MLKDSFHLCAVHAIIHTSIEDIFRTNVLEMLFLQTVNKNFVVTDFSSVFYSIYEDYISSHLIDRENYDASGDETESNILWDSAKSMNSIV